MNIIFKIFNYIKVKLIKKFYLKSKIDYETKFNLIYKTNYWSDPESVSGSGSTRYKPKMQLRILIKL